MALSFAFRPTPAEHARVWTFMLRRKRSYWILIGALVLVVLLLAIVPALQGYSAGNIVATILPYLLIFGGILVALPIIQRWQLRGLYQHTPSLQQEQTHEFSEDGFRMSNPLANTLVHWNAFLEVVETKEFLLLYVSRSIAYFLPKRAIHDPGQLRELRSLLHRELGGGAAKLRLLAA